MNIEEGCYLPDIITARRINTDTPRTGYSTYTPVLYADQMPAEEHEDTWVERQVDKMFAPYQQPADPRLSDALIANEEWFEAMLDAAEIIGSRRYKYSSEDPYSNFIVIAEYLSQRWKQPVTVLMVFDMLHALKFSRWINGSGDYDDETEIDNLLDDINYKLLEIGYRKRLASQAKDK